MFYMDVGTLLTTWIIPVHGAMLKWLMVDIHMMSRGKPERVILAGNVVFPLLLVFPY